ncbi:MAG TPA: histidine phosphatase family protein [Burkholderiaceae bacterium]|nr:histidine phosphatase family protein [Burkholderiaceae bacterium]
MRRRALLGLGFAVTAARGGTPAPGAVLLLRHAATDPGVGDPPGFVLDQCATQRNLSAEGRAEARAIGRALAARGWVPRAIRSSRWCRCLDTAQGIASGLGASAPRVDPWPALDSFFDDRARAPAQTAQLAARWRELASADGFELWVTHQVNITALAQRATAMGDGVWLRRGERQETSPFER